MDESFTEKESLLLGRIQQLEKEKDELHKDIEQLCMQQAGPGYLALATRLHFERTAGLEQEIENLKKNLVNLTRDNQNLHEELAEAYRIKGQLADLHSSEVAKNKEAEKQVKFFHGCVAAAFSERDQSIMEAEKAKEKEECTSRKLEELEKRLDKAMSDIIAQQRSNDLLQSELSKHEEHNKDLRKVVEKFVRIKQHSIEELEDLNSDEKCSFLLNDPDEVWTFNDSSITNYISLLEEERERLRCSVNNLQNKLRVGLEIENHLKKKVHELERKRLNLSKIIIQKISELRDYHSHNRTDIMCALEETRLHMNSALIEMEDKMRQIEYKGQSLGPPQSDSGVGECRDVHINIDAEAKFLVKNDIASLATSVTERKRDTSEALAQALQDKVATLLLLSQQEERHLLERNVNAALQKKIEELQRNLLQVTNEKVKALMELAQQKEKYHTLREKWSNEMKQGKELAEAGVGKITAKENDGRLRNLLKKTYLKRWVGPLDISGNEAEGNLSSGENSPNRLSSMDIARMKIENITLRESVDSMEHLTSSIHRLRLSLLKVKDTVCIGSEVAHVSEALTEIITEAKLLKMAFGSSLPISWSAEADGASVGSVTGDRSSDASEEPSREKMDVVSAAGIEMVELMILAAQILKDGVHC